MHIHRQEFSYLVVFIASLVLAGSFCIQLSRTYIGPAISGGQSACQVMVRQSTQSSRAALLAVLAGTLTVLALKVIASVVLYRQFMASLDARAILRIPTKLARICQRHGINPSTLILIRDQKLIALTVGARSPHLLVSSGLIKQLSARQLEAVVLHEHYHARHHHPLVLLVGSLIAKTLFFLPMLSDLLHHMQMEFEYRADQAAVLQQRGTRYLREAMALVLQDPLPAFSPMAAFQGSSIQQRISLLGTVQRPSFHAHAYSTVVTTLVIIVALLLARPAAAQVPSIAAPSNCSFLGCVSACMQETLDASGPRVSKLGVSSPSAVYSPSF